MRCPSCNKFSGLDTQDPEVNDLTLSEERDQVSYDVRIVRNSSCCGDEMKGYDFNGDAEVPKEISERIAAVLKADPEADFEAEEGGADILEEGGGRYAKSYYGFCISVDITSDSDKAKELYPDGLGAFDITDKCAASEMEELA